MLVAVTALVLAASGTAVAASLINGDKLIKKHSLSGNRLRNHTVTGKQIKLSSLGKVPSAKNADHATTADSATKATTATNATNATNANNASNANNANTVGGQPASAFEPSSAFIRTGLVKAAVGQTVPFSSFGPFTLTLTCTDNGGGSFTVQVDAKSSEDNSDIFGAIATPAGTSEEIDARTGTTFTEVDDNLADFIAPSGKAYQTDYTFGVHAFGADCFGIGLTGQS